MLQQGVIQPSHSPWALPILQVKRNGTYRFCIDYRKSNEATKKDVNPLPRVDDQLDALHGSHHFSTIDVCSGYWQVSKLVLLMKTGRKQIYNPRWVMGIYFTSLWG